MPANDEKLKPCPFCGSKDISCGAFSFVPDCNIGCNSCGANIEKEVSWEGCETETEHDAKCEPILIDAWNIRTGEDDT